MQIIERTENTVVIELNNCNEILFSYQTPVAGWKDGVFFKTDKQWSRTTSKHIAKYLVERIDTMRLVKVWPQAVIDQLVKEI